MAEPTHIIEARKTGYWDDFAAWAEAQSEHLRFARFDSLDITNLIDEVTGLARRDFDRFVGAIEIVLLHILKWDYQPAERKRGWALSILEHRRRVERSLKNNPSFRRRFEEALGEAFETAVLKAARETGLPTTDFPAKLPYDWTDLMSRPFDPNTPILLEPA